MEVIKFVCVFIYVLINSIVPLILFGKIEVIVESFKEGIQIKHLFLILVFPAVLIFIVVVFLAWGILLICKQLKPFLNKTIYKWR